MAQVATVNTDSYKLSHKGFMNEGTTMIYSNFTPRSFNYMPVNKERFDNKLVTFGLQRFIKDFLINEFNTKFFNVEKNIAIKRMKRRCDNYLGKDKVPMDHFEQLHDLGYLPLVIKALPEGSRVDEKVPYITFFNTHPDFAWLTNYIETVLSAELWKPATVATIAYELRKMCDEFALKTVGHTGGVEFQCHDFSFRGMANRQDAANCGAGHLLSFVGTDNIPAIDTLEDYYCVDVEKEFVAVSVAASEHSIACLGTAVEGELESYRKWITKDYPTGIVSLVSDTYDYFRVITEFAKELKDDILNRQPDENGLAKVVFRPDCYDEDTKILTKKGWKYFRDLTEEDLVAQETNGEMVFVKPSKIIKQKYQGVMHHYQDFHGKVDLLVTPNHRMVLEQGGEERIVFSEKLGSKGHHKQKMFRSAKAKAFTGGLSFLERIKIAFQADGSYKTKGEGVRFNFAKGRKIGRLENLLVLAGLDYKIYKLQDGRVEVSVNCDHSLFSKNFEWVDTNNLCGKWCEDFIEELSHWDSSIRNEGRFKFDTTNQDVMSVVELIAIHAGKGILISEAEDTRKAHYSKVYTAHIMDNNTVGGQSWNKTEKDYDGFVYCVTVPSGKVIVKRNRCTMVCGNSGDPVKILCGIDVDYTVESRKDIYQHNCVVFIKDEGKYYQVTDVSGENSFHQELAFTEISENEIKGSVELLWETFGGTITDTGYKLLNERVGLIYGDSITQERAIEILSRLEKKGFASTNVVFGIGSYTYNYLTRDCAGLAVKATAAVVDNEVVELFKDPITDDGVKKSAKGLLRVEREGDKFVLNDSQSTEQQTEGCLEMVFLNGKLVREYTFAEVQENMRNT